MTKNTVEHIIRRFGSQQRVAELLGIWQTAVSGWVRRGAIPARRQEELLAIARREGIELSPEEFFGLIEDGETAADVPLRAAAAGGAGTRSAPLTSAPPAPAPSAEIIALHGPNINRVEQRDLYEVGELPPLGHVPRNMYAWAIRKERHGEPATAMQEEVVPTHTIGDDEVLVMVMAAGVNYNGIWAALGKPISPLDGHKQPFHIAGSDASGVVWAVGSKVKRWKVGDEVVAHCNQDDGDDEECNGGEPMFSSSQRIWGYETPDGRLRPVLPGPVAPADAAAASSELGGIGLRTS